MNIDQILQSLSATSHWRFLGTKWKHTQRKLSCHHMSRHLLIYRQKVYLQPLQNPVRPPLADPPANLQIIQIDVELSVADGSFIDVATLTPETPDTGGPLDLGPNITLDADGVLTYEAIWRYVETQVPIAVSETLPVTIHSLGRQGHAVFTGVGILKVEKLRGSLRLDHLAGPKQMTASGVLVFAPKVRNGLVIDENASMEFTVNGVSERLPSEVRLAPQQNRLAQKTTTGVFLTKQQSSIGALIGYFGDDCDGDCATEN